MRWSKGWIAAAGVFSVVAAIGGTALALAGSSSPAPQSRPAGKEVCTGQPLAFQDSSGPAAVLSDQFPLGTELRITNVSNGRSLTLAVTGVASSCALVNTAAFESLHSPNSGQGKEESVLRRVRVEIVGNAPPPAPLQSATRASSSRVRPSGVVGQVVCDGATVGLSAVGGEAGAFSSLLPIGTSIRVTNLDNGRQTTVKVVGVGSSCVVLNSAAFKLVGESGKNVIKRAQIEKVT
jgi:hypothetical protein